MNMRTILFVMVCGICTQVLSMTPLTEKDNVWDAARKGDLNRMEAIVSKKSAFIVFAPNPRANTVLHCAAMNNRTNILKFLKDKFKSKWAEQIKVENRFGNTPLLEAAKNGSLDAMKFLLENGSKLDAHEKVGANLLHLAFMSGHTNVVNYIRNNYKEDWKKLIQAADANGDTPLHYAARWAPKSIMIDYVQKNDPDLFWKTLIHKQNKNNQTLLDVVKTRGKGGIDYANKLLKLEQQYFLQNLAGALQQLQG